MATDFGPASGNGTLNIGSGSTAVFIEQHVQGPVTTAASSGIPGGTSGPTSALNNLGPADFISPTDPTAYGTVSNGNAVTAIANLGGTSASFGPNNPSGAGNLNLFRFKNPAAFEAFQLSEIL